MIRLIKNELMKIFARKGSWIIIAAIVCMTIFSAVYQYQTRPETSDDWKAAAEQQILSSRQALETPFLPGFQKSELLKSIKIQEYILEHEINPETSFWEQVEKDASLITLAALFASVLSGMIVAAEFQQGTMKMLMIRPIGRGTILLSKYLAVISYGFILFLVILGTSVLVNGILLGFTGPVRPYLYIEAQGQVEAMNMVTRVIQSFGLKSVQIIMFVTFAFMLSVLSRSKTLAVGVSLITVILGPQLTSAFAKYSWAKFIMFAHTDLSLVVSSNPYGVTLGFSVLVLVFYFLVMNIISWTVFKRADIAN